MMTPSNNFSSNLLALEDAELELQYIDILVSSLKFNPADGESVKDVIRQMEEAVDLHMYNYSENKLVMQMVNKFKERHSEAYRNKAKELESSGSN